MNIFKRLKIAPVLTTWQILKKLIIFSLVVSIARGLIELINLL